MVQYAFFVELIAKPGKEAEVEAFLQKGATMAAREAGIVSWYGVKEDTPGRYGIVDTFADAAGRDAHMDGDLAKALFAKADELFSEAPRLHRLQVIAQK